MINDFEQLMTVVDVALADKKRQQEAGEQLDTDALRKNIRERVLIYTEVTGEELTNAQIEEAISAYFSGMYTFKEPKHTFGYTLATWYADRQRIARNFLKVAIPSAVAIAAAGALVGVSSFAVKQSHLASERKVEERVSNAYSLRNNVSGDIDVLAGSAESLPERKESEVMTIVNTARTRLMTLDDFFANYCPKSGPSEAVTQQNYNDVDGKISAVLTTLEEAGNDVRAGRNVIVTHERLVSEQKNLDALIQEITNMNPPDSMLQKAKTFYANGKAVAESENLPELSSYVKQLRELKGDITSFTVLPEQLEKAYAGVKAVAKEKLAVDKADALYAEGKTFVSSVDVARLKLSVSSLQELAVILNSEFTLTVVNRDGVKSGIDRYYTDEKGKRSSGYYLIVEALDARGNAVAMPIKNEENGKTVVAKMWGERVPQEVYTRVGSDKMDDGIIQDSVVGKKQRGYLTAEMVMKGVERKGQITEW